MNAIDKFASLLTLTREPFPASSKSTIAGSRPDLRVPVREVLLTNGERVSLYDTSGPYTDPQAKIDIRSGLAPLRARWIEERADTEALQNPSSDYGRARLADPRRRALRRQAAIWPAEFLAARSHHCIARAEFDILAPASL